MKFIRAIWRKGFPAWVDSSHFFHEMKMEGIDRVQTTEQTLIILQASVESVDRIIERMKKGGAEHA